MSLEVSPTSKSIPAASVAQVVKPIPYPSSVKATYLAPPAPGKLGHHPNDNNIQSANAFSADSKELNDAAASEEEIWAEAALVTDISQLWSSQKKKTSSLRRSREEFDILKSNRGLPKKMKLSLLLKRRAGSSGMFAPPTFWKRFERFQRFLQ
jgi:hypothetical protein